jgi:hypothetical protein
MLGRRKDKKMPIPVNIEEVFREIREEVIWIHGRWIIYRQLFLHSDKRIDLLNEVASALFYLLQNLLQDEVQVALSKLTDPARTGKFENLSLEQLQERIEKDGDKKLSVELHEILKKLQVECVACRTWRNKQLAHLDLNTSLQKITDVLPPVTIEQIELALNLAREYLNKIERFYTESETGYDHFIMSSSDGDALVAMLKLGLRYEELRVAEKVPWEDSSHSEWRDA